MRSVIGQIIYFEQRNKERLFYPVLKKTGALAMSAPVILLGKWCSGEHEGN